MLKQVLLTIVINISLVANVMANQVEIVKVKMESSGNSWTFNVTLLHEDKGWNHYADGWRVVDAKGKELGYRKLWHPHVNEQPFTRSLSNVTIPGTEKIIYIEAHDKVHGWSKQRLKIDLDKPQGDRYLILGK